MKAGDTYHFTFQYGSINTIAGFPGSQEDITFTFQYGSINTW